MPSPICEVKVGAGPWQSTTFGINATPGETVIIRLLNQADVRTWLIQCITSDELSDHNAVTASLVIDALAKTATFTAPVSAGRALRFLSLINGGIGPDGKPVSSYATTFGIYTLTALGKRVIAADEGTESDPVFGWISSVNSIIRNPSPGSGEANTVSNVGAGVQAVKAKVGVDIPVRTFVGLKSTVIALNSDTIEVDADGVATLTTSATGNIDGQTTVDGGSRPASKIHFSGAAPVLRSLTGGIDKRRPLILEPENDLVVTNEYAPATAVDRITTGTGADVTVKGGSIGIVTWDATATNKRWRLATGSGGSGGASPAGNNNDLQKKLNTGFAPIAGNENDTVLRQGGDWIPNPAALVPSGAAGAIPVVDGIGGLAATAKRAYEIGLQVNYTFPSDANQTLSAANSLATILVINAGVLTAQRTITVNRGPALATVGDQIRVVNNNANPVAIKWATGTTIVVPAGKSMDIGSDGVNAINNFEEGSNGGGASGYDLSSFTGYRTTGDGGSVTAHTLDISSFSDGTYDLFLKVRATAGYNGSQQHGFYAERRLGIGIHGGQVKTTPNGGDLFVENVLTRVMPHGTAVLTAAATLSYTSGGTTVLVKVRGEVSTTLDWSGEIEIRKSLAAGSPGTGWGSAVAWDPITEYGSGNVLVWYEASLGVTTSGGNLTQILDQVGDDPTKKTLTNQSGNIPYTASGPNGKPYFSSAGTAYLDGGGAWTSAPSGVHTHFLVCRVGSNILFAGGAGDNRMHVVTGGHSSLYSGGGFVSTASDDTAVWMVVACVYDPAGNDSLYINDPSSAAVSGASGTQVIDRITLFNIAGGGGTGSGDIAEMITVKGSDSTKRTNAMTALKAKYGIA